MEKHHSQRPNVLLVFADQWRAQATGYAGNGDVATPRLDRLASQSIHATRAISGCPVCAPARASLLTGQYPLTHGVFVNDVPLEPHAPTLGEVFRAAGYRTGYIGKWHVDGPKRSAYIPPHRRRGFDYWKVLECTHAYNHSAYFADDERTPRQWEGYDAFAQTEDACRYLKDAAAASDPYLLVLSWGPPHAPYHTAPQSYRKRYAAERLTLRPNVPVAQAQKARDDLAGYYAHCTALDDCMGTLMRALDDLNLAEDTILLFFSDHGDMLGSQGAWKKQQPWDESLRVPFLLRYPARYGWRGREMPALIDMPDYLPTLAGLCRLETPSACEGLDWSSYFDGGDDPSGGARLIQCAHPFGQWWRGDGGREYRGLRTQRYTYVETLNGPWLLHDNQADPYQLVNLIQRSDVESLRKNLHGELHRRLEAKGDEFLPGRSYIQQWGYDLDDQETVPYQP